MFNVKNNLSSKVINYLLYNETENHYNLRRGIEFRIQFVNLVDPCVVHHGSENFSLLDPKKWEIVLSLKKLLLLTVSESKPGNGYQLVVPVGFVEIALV